MPGTSRWHQKRDLDDFRQSLFPIAVAKRDRKDDRRVFSSPIMLIKRFEKMAPFLRNGSNACPPCWQTDTIFSYWWPWEATQTVVPLLIYMFRPLTSRVDLKDSTYSTQIRHVPCTLYCNNSRTRVGAEAMSKGPREAFKRMWSKRLPRQITKTRMLSWCRTRYSSNSKEVMLRWEMQIVPRTIGVWRCFLSC